MNTTNADTYSRLKCLMSCRGYVDTDSAVGSLTVTEALNTFYAQKKVNLIPFQSDGEDVSGRLMLQKSVVATPVRLSNQVCVV